jgi:hypothetical protein
MTTDNFCFYLQNRLIQTSQTGGQQYSDPFSIPWFECRILNAMPIALAPSKQATQTSFQFFLKKSEKVQQFT